MDTTIKNIKLIRLSEIDKKHYGAVYVVHDDVDKEHFEEIKGALEEYLTNPEYHRYAGATRYLRCPAYGEYYFSRETMDKIDRAGYNPIKWEHHTGRYHVWGTWFHTKEWIRIPIQAAVCLRFIVGKLQETLKMIEKKYKGAPICNLTYSKIQYDWDKSINEISRELEVLYYTMVEIRITEAMALITFHKPFPLTGFTFNYNLSLKIEEVMEI